MDQTIHSAGVMDRPLTTSLELHSIRMPFSELASQAMASSPNGLGMAIPAEEPWEAGDFVVAKLTDEAGTEGWAEVFMWLPETGVSPGELMLSVPNHLARYVLGRSAVDIRSIRSRMDRNVTRNEVGKGLLDMACHDLAGRQLGRPVHDLLGGRGSDRIDLAALIPLVDPAFLVAICEHYVAEGYKTLRIKLGTSPTADRNVIAAVREKVGDEIRIRVDYNQAYSAPEAVQALRMLEPYGIDAAEQPLAIGDFLGMAEVQRQTSIPLFLHEGAFSISDIVTLTELGGCRVVGLNMERPGGLVGALNLADWASVRGMGIIVHNQCLGLGTAAHVHFAAARQDQLGHAMEMAGEVMFEHMLVNERLEVVDGSMLIPTGPGFGVTVDRDALDNYSIAEPIVVTVDDVL